MPFVARQGNLVLGYATDDIEVLRSAIAYLENWKCRSSS